MQTTSNTGTACRRVGSPVGPLLVSACNGALACLTWCDENAADVPPVDAADKAVLDQAAAQLAAYFAGEVQRFAVPVAPAGTPFERRVWAAISAIPFGRTRTYGALARDVVGVARAVGQACGANPIPIIIPCHRVVASGGRLGGFSGGRGTVSKRALLAHEGAVPDDGDLFAPASSQVVTIPAAGR